MLMTRLVPVLAGLGLMASLAGPAAGAKPDCDADPSHPSCSGDGGGGSVVSDVSTEAQWSGWRAAGDAPRTCLFDGSNQGGATGSYHCDTGPPQIFFDLTGIWREETTRQGDAALCDTFDGITVVPDSAYKFRWLEDCSSGVCEIMVQNWFHDYNNENHGIVGVDLVKMTAFADAIGPGDPPEFSDLNPFADPVALKIDQVVMTFAAEGKSKILAECHFTFAEPQVGEMQLISTPLP